MRFTARLLCICIAVAMAMRTTQNSQRASSSGADTEVPNDGELSPVVVNRPSQTIYGAEAYSVQKAIDPEVAARAPPRGGECLQRRLRLLPSWGPVVQLARSV